jgi:hypothetical protein
MPVDEETQRADGEPILCVRIVYERIIATKSFSRTETLKMTFVGQLRWREK